MYSIFLNFSSSKENWQIVFYFNETLQGRRDKAKLKLRYKLASMSEDRYPRRVFTHIRDAKPRRGRQRSLE